MGDPTSDGVILPKYEGTQEKYKGKNVLISGESNKTYLGIEDSKEIPVAWLSYFVNMDEKWHGDTKDSVYTVDLKSIPSANDTWGKNDKIPEEIKKQIKGTDKFWINVIGPETEVVVKRTFRARISGEEKK